MTTFLRIDPETGQLIECGSRTVVCETAGCENVGISIEVADDPNGAVVCGPCGRWIIAPPTEQETPA
ncbi:hypothetical protein JTF60_gp17 [Microbacterium phage Efeko]|uniref:Uncharacterized protein n=1 Tax=Microbacterium phage Efeko TaxID=2315704 RepID=A0A386KP19_9CAUD|nr:hypothetical protein JTF60_gp17 [Microbacterium phage Efeko]AYD86263.1 hypothetical protein SEA_EFEKO_17 [Microbacterium phage Efeko]